VRLDRGRAKPLSPATLGALAAGELVGRAALANRGGPS